MESLEAVALHAYSVLRVRFNLGTMICLCEVNCSRIVPINTAIHRIDAYTYV